MRNRLILIVCVLIFATGLTGCILTDVRNTLLLMPKAQKLQARIQERGHQAHDIGQKRAFEIFFNKIGSNNGEFPEVNIAYLQILIDNKIAETKNKDAIITTIDFYQTLRAFGIDESSASACKQELNAVLENDILASSTWVGAERKTVIQFYYIGFFEGIIKCMIKLDLDSGRNPFQEFVGEIQ